MEVQSTFLGRLGEKAAGWIILILLLAAAVGIWRMDPTLRSDIWSFIWRTAVWIVMAAIIPWLGQLAIRPVLAAGTNWAAFGLVAGLMLLDLIAAAIVMTGWPAGAWGWIAGLAALAASGTYNYWVTEYLAERAGG